MTTELVLPSASAIELAMDCAASVHLPKADQSSEATESGNALHEFLRNVVLGMPADEAELLVPERFRSAAHDIDVEKIRPLADVRSEVSISYNPVQRTAKILGENLSRDYRGHGWISDAEFPGTPDLFGRDPGGTLTVLDFKTGSARLVASARENWQLRTLAVGLSKLLGVSRVRAGIIRTQGDVRYDECEYDEFDLEEYADKLDGLFRILKAQHEAGRPEMTVGRQCDYCPSFRFCPAKTSMALAVVTKPELTVESISALISAGDPAAAYAKFREANQVMFKLSEAFKQHATRNPIPMPDGRLYGPVVTQEKSIDANIAARVLRDMFGTDVAKSAMEFTTTKTAIEKALSHVSARGTKAAKVRAVMAEIKAAGGLTVTPKTKIQAYTPTPAREEAQDVEGSGDNQSGPDLPEGLGTPG